MLTSELFVFIQQKATELSENLDMFSRNSNLFSTIPENKEEVDKILSEFLPLVQPKLGNPDDESYITVVNICELMQECAEDYRASLGKSTALVDTVLVGFIDYFAGSQWVDYALSTKNLKGNHDDSLVIPAKLFTNR